MKKFAIITAACLALASAVSATITFTGSAILNLNGGGGTAWTPGTLAVWVVDTNGDGFAGASPNSLYVGDSTAPGVSFGAADDIVLFSNATIGGGGTAALNGEVFGFPAGGSIGDNWGIFVFDADSDGAATLSAGTYGFFTSQGGSGDWDLPADGTSWGFNAAPGAGQFQQIANVTGSSLTVVPEPSTYAALSGLLALSWVMLRRRRA